MDIEILREIPAIQEFFNIEEDKELPEGTKLFLDAMSEVTIPKGQDIVTYGNECDDGMYIILEGTTDVLSNHGTLINTLGKGDFIGEMGLINDDKRGATVRATSEVVCANISKTLFEEMAASNKKLYGTFINMLYNKTTKLVTERERIKSELEVATRIQDSCLEHDFTEFNKIENVEIIAKMRPAKEVGGDFYDVFMIDDKHLCYLIADVSGKGVPAAIFMSMAKTYIKTYATLGLPLAEVASKANNQLCYKNDQGMFVTAFICVLDLETNEVRFVNAGHNRPFVKRSGEKFEMIPAKVNLVFGMMEDIPYKEQSFVLEPGDSIYMYTDGVTEAVNPKDELLGDSYAEEILNKNMDSSSEVERFVDTIFAEVDAFADGAMQADDITMVYLSRQ